MHRIGSIYYHSTLLNYIYLFPIASPESEAISLKCDLFHYVIRFSSLVANDSISIVTDFSLVSQTQTGVKGHSASTADAFNWRAAEEADATTATNLQIWQIAFTL